MFVCLFVYILSLSLFLFVCLLLSTSARVSRFFLFPRPSPRDLSRVARVVLWEGRGIFFWRVRESRMPRHVPFPEQSVETSDVDKISGFRSGFITYIPPPLFHPLSFLVEIFFHPPSPRYSADLSSYKDVYRREAIGFFPTTVYRLEHEEEASGILYSRAHVRARIQGVPFSTFSKMVARRRRMIFKSVGISIRKLMIIKEEWLIFDVISNEFLLSIQVIGEFLRSRALSFVMVMPLPRYIFGDGSFFQRKIKKKKIPLIYLLILSRLFFFLRIVID